jgi:hypothetical protein
MKDQDVFAGMNRRQLSILFRNIGERDKAYKVLAKRTVKSTSKAKIAEVKRSFLVWLYRSPAKIKTV